MKVEITGIAPHIDGDYDLDWGSLTNRELHQIKTVSGVRPMELIDAFASGDAAFACVVATVVCQRAGHRINEDFFLDAQGGAVTFIFEEPKGDEDPPTSPGAKPGTKKNDSGTRSAKSSGSPETDPSASGELT